MLNVFVCEDNNQYREKITKIAANCLLIEEYDMKMALSTASPDEILNYIEKNNRPGLYFLDIELKHALNGITLAEKIRKHDPRGFIVFITSYTDKLPLTFQYKVEAMDYIEKQDLCLEKRIIECMKNAYSKYTTISHLPHKKVFIAKIANREIFIDTDAILYFSTSVDIPHKINLYAGKIAYNLNETLSHVMDRLDDSFIRCHHSYIVNLQKVCCFDKSNLLLHFINNQGECPVSPNNVKKVSKQLNIVKSNASMQLVSIG
jgi:two-component system response regulator AgrA